MSYASTYIVTISRVRACQICEVLLPHFRSAFTAKELKFHFRNSALHWLPKIWSPASALPLCFDYQRSIPSERIFSLSIFRWNQYIFYQEMFGLGPIYDAVETLAGKWRQNWRQSSRRRPDVIHERRLIPPLSHVRRLFLAPLDQSSGSQVVAKILQEALVASWNFSSSYWLRQNIKFLFLNDCKCYSKIKSSHLLLPRMAWLLWWSYRGLSTGVF